MHDLGRRIHGQAWTHYSHHCHNFDECKQAVKDFNSVARARRRQNALERREAANKGTRISSFKSEDRGFKAAEKAHILESPELNSLDNIMAPCYHRDIIGEDERKMWEDLSIEDWRRSTEFKGLSLNARDNKPAIMTYLLDYFDVNPVKVAKCSNSLNDLNQLWGDQVAKNYVPMSEVAFYSTIRFLLCTYQLVVFHICY